MDIDRTCWQVALPGNGVDIDSMTAFLELARDAQHVALHAAEREILEYEESEFHRAMLIRIN